MDKTSKSIKPIDLTNSVNLIDFLMLGLALISYSGIILLALHAFFAKLVVILGLILTLSYFFFSGYNKIILPKLRPTILMLLLLLFALFFRTNPALYIMGGQDQGLYVNMASYFNNHHSTFIQDTVRSELPNQLLRQTYDSNNFLGKPQTGDSELPGVYIKNPSLSQYEFQFYPLHPIFMAIYANLFGSTKLVYSVVGFGLLSIFFFSLICYRLSNFNITAAGVGGILMALNPIHIFFSKFPVSEITDMAFLLAGFYYLIIYWQQEKLKQTNNFYLLLSALLIGCTFFIRVDGFILMAWFSLMFLLCLINRHYIPKFNSLLLYFVAIAGIYSLSLYYGLIFNFYYTLGIYSSSFSILFGAHWALSLMILTITYLLVCLFLGFKQLFSQEKLSHYHLILNRFLVLMIGLIILLGLYRLYQFSFTTILNQHPRFISMSHQGRASFAYVSIVVIAHYISYVGSLFFLYALLTYLKKPSTILTTAVLLFTAISLFFSLDMEYSVPYQYYYLRYFLPDTLFSIILIISLQLSEIFNSSKESRIGNKILLQHN